MILAAAAVRVSRGKPVGVWRLLVSSDVLISSASQRSERVCVNHEITAGAGNIPECINRRGCRVVTLLGMVVLQTNQRMCACADSGAKSVGKSAGKDSSRGGKTSPNDTSPAESESDPGPSQDGTAADASAEEAEAPRKNTAKGKKKRKRTTDTDVTVRCPAVAVCW